MARESTRRAGDAPGQQRSAHIGLAGRRIGPLLVASVCLSAAPADVAARSLVYPPWKHCYGLHRVTQTHLTLRAGFQYRFDDPQGVAAVKLAAEDDSTTRRDDDELTVFGVNSGQHMIIYNTSLTAIRFYGSEGDGIAEFRNPHGIAADRAGNVVVADTGNDRLHLLRYADDRLRHVRFIVGPFADEPLRRPTGVALEAGEIYVCDPEHARVLVLGLDGNLRRVLAPERNGVRVLQQPFGVAAIRSQSSHNYFGADFVVVTDSSRARVTRLAHDGRILDQRRVGDLGRQAREFGYAAIDYHANVYVSDRSGRLHKFDRDLRYLLSVGRLGNGDYEFDEPRGIGLYRRFGQIFVAERAGAQYFWTGTDVFSPQLVDLERDAQGVWHAMARYFLTEYARVKLELVDAHERPIAELQGPTWQSVGPIQTPVSFRLPDTAGNLRLRVEAIPAYSARRYGIVQALGPPMAGWDARRSEP